MFDDKKYRHINYKITFVYQHVISKPYFWPNIKLGTFNIEILDFVTLR